MEPAKRAFLLTIPKRQEYKACEEGGTKEKKERTALPAPGVCRQVWACRPSLCCCLLVVGLSPHQHARGMLTGFSAFRGVRGGQAPKAPTQPKLQPSPSVSSAKSPNRSEGGFGGHTLHTKPVSQSVRHAKKPNPGILERGVVSRTAHTCLFQKRHPPLSNHALTCRLHRNLMWYGWVRAGLWLCCCCRIHVPLAGLYERNE